MTFGLFLIALLAAGIALMMAPLESLGWWAGWYEHEQDKHVPHRGFAVMAGEVSSGKKAYVMFLDGISRAATVENIRQVEQFILRLKDDLTDVEIVHDLFPYSVTGIPLTEQRVLSRFWTFADGRKRTANVSAIGFFINIRNLLQVAVASDRRYATIYHQGEAQLLINSLLKHGYDINKPSPLYVIGYSGGAQLAVGAAPYLQEVLGVPVTVITLGGVVSNNRHMENLAGIHHLTGTWDVVEKIGAVIFPRRWPIFPQTNWNKAKRRGVFKRYRLGPMTHMARASYLDDSYHTADGRSYFDITLKAILDIITRTQKNMVNEPPEPMHPDSEQSPHSAVGPEGLAAQRDSN